jgi:hypothetical protein
MAAEPGLASTESEAVMEAIVVHEGADCDEWCHSYHSGAQACSGGALAGTKQVGEFVLVARTPSDLREFTASCWEIPEAKKVSVILRSIASWRMMPTVSPGEDLFWRHTLELKTQRVNGVWCIEVSFVKEVPAEAVLWSVSRMMDGHRSPWVGPLGGLTGPGGIYTHLYKDHPKAKEISRKTLAETSLSCMGYPEIPPVDERTINPIGFVRETSDQFGTLDINCDGQLAVTLPTAEAGGILIPGGNVTEHEIEELRALRYVTIDSHAGGFFEGRDREIARALANLAAAGVPIVSSANVNRVARLLGEDFAALISRGGEPGNLSDAITREEYSIQLRRLALGNFGTRACRSALVGKSDSSLLGTPEVSVVLCSRRPEMVQHAMRQILHQRGVDLEVIVVLHGASANRIPAGTLDGSAVVLQVDGGESYGAALNHGLRAASGAYIAKMDDDDWYGPHHLSDLVMGIHYSGSDLVGASMEFIYLEELDITVYRGAEAVSELPNMMTVHGFTSGGAIMMTRGVAEAVGGFRHVPVYEDSELIAAVTAMGGRVYRQHGLNYLYRRGKPSRHTWGVETAHFLEGEVRQWKGRYFNNLMSES